jgi:cyclic nucleotide gated channel
MFITKTMHASLRNFRFQNEIEVQSFRTSPLQQNLSSRTHGRAHDPRKCRLGFRGGCLEKACRNPTLKDRVLSRAFSEELESLMHAAGSSHLFFDPRGHLIHLWSKIFLSACLLSLFVDPLFLYLTGTQRNNHMCIEFKYSLALTLSMIRSLLDLFYAAHILFRFRTAFIAPSSRVFGQGELVIQPYKIARRYLGRTFWFDLVTALPLPQVGQPSRQPPLMSVCQLQELNSVVWFVMHAVRDLDCYTEAE